MKTPLLVLILFSALSLHAQNLNGFWKGSLGMPAACFPVNNIELQITMDGNIAKGASYHYQNIDYYVKKSVSGAYDFKSKKLIIHEGLITTFKIPEHCKVCIKNFVLTYSREGNVETLTGEWDGKIAGTGLDCAIGPIVLSRIKESAFKEIPEVEVDTGTIRLDFYDNGEIDGDSITVRINKQTVLSHQKLSAKPITTYVNIDLNNTFQEIEMIAENLGSIPPNTALLIITAGEKRYQLFLTSSEEKAARVRFVYNKESLKQKAL